MIESPSETVAVAEREPKTTASAVIRGLSPDEPFDARAAIAEHSLEDSGPAVVDFAVEEFFRETEAGRAVTPEEFAARFPTHYETLVLLLNADGLLGESTAAEPEDIGWPAVGQSYQGFRLIFEVGRGSFSRVFLARETALGERPVVVKVCRGGAREAGILGRLKHPHVGEVYSVQFDQSAGLTTICMPFDGAGTLNHEIAREFPSRETERDNKAAANRSTARREYLERVIEVGRQIAGALAYTHEQNVFHGDIKPENIVLTEGAAKLIDFSLSRRRRETQGPVGGTYPYMAPEHLRALMDGNFEDPVTSAGDVYSLGATLFHAFTGRLPYANAPSEDRPASAVAEFRRRDNGTAVYRELRGYLPRQFRKLERAIASCLHENPAMRPSAGELAAMWPTVSEAPTRSRLNRAAGLAAVILLSAAATMAVVPAVVPEPSPQPPPAPNKRINLEEEGRAALEDKEYDRAVEFFSKLAKDPAHPRHVEHQWCLGYALAKTADSIKPGPKATPRALVRYARAIASFEAALKADPDLLPPQLKYLRDNIGWCRIRMGKLRYSIEAPCPKEFEDWDDTRTYFHFVNLLAKRSTATIHPNYALLSYAVRKWPGNLKLLFVAANLHATEATKGAEPAGDLPDHTALVLEYCWRAVDQFPKEPREVKFRLKQLVRFSPGFLRNLEMGWVQQRVYRAPLLRYPR